MELFSALLILCDRWILYRTHDDVIKWKHFPRYWPFVRGIHRSRWIPAQRPVTRSFDGFFDLRLNKRLSKQLWGWWFETIIMTSFWCGRSCTSLTFRSYDDDNAIKYKQISIIFIMCLSNACCSMALGVTTCCYCIYRYYVKVYVHQMMIIKNVKERKNVLILSIIFRHCDGICHSKTTTTVSYSIDSRHCAVECIKKNAWVTVN